LLKALLPPVAALLVAGAVGAYFLSLEPASEAYDQALVDVGIALGERIRSAGETVSFDLPGAAEQVLRTDKYDTIYYGVRRADGSVLAGDPGLPPVPASQKPEDGVIAYDAEYLGRKIRVAALSVPCGGRICTVQVAETTNKRRKLARNIVLSSLVPELAARVRALIRRSQAQTGPKIVHGPLILDTLARRAQLGGVPLDLAAREWAVLEMLLARVEKIVSKDAIIQAVASWGEELTPNAIEVYVSRLRAKLDPAGVKIRTVRGFGYMLEEFKEKKAGQ